MRPNCLARVRLPLLENFNMKSEPSPKAAVDELRIIEGPSPYDPTETVYYLKNDNELQPIRATIEKSSPKSFKIEKPDRSFSRQYYPQEGEIHVPAGGRQYLGKKVLQIESILGPIEFEYEYYAQEFVIRGASHLISWPPPPSDEVAESFIWSRTIPIQGSGDPTFKVMDVAVNAHWYRAIEFTLTDLTNHGIWGDTLLPEKQTHFNPLPRPMAYNVRGARFTS